jgi:predicted nuclease of predicted toxin-antitoxin system
MKLLADENFPITSVKILLQYGYDIKAIGLDWPGILDSDVINIAIKEERTIITFDRDYGELIFKVGYRPDKGVIYMRWLDFQPHEPGEQLHLLFASNKFKFEGMFTVVSDYKIRQRRYL